MKIVFSFSKVGALYLVEAIDNFDTGRVQATGSAGTVQAAMDECLANLQVRLDELA